MDEQLKNTGLISCIIPVYNRQELIVECVQSVLTQTYNDYEIIIVDDGSTDQTPEVISKLAQQSNEKIRILQQTNQGPGVARQHGLDHAQGKYVQFLDSDDLILPHKFELFINAFESEEQPDIVYATTHYYAVSDPQNYVIWKQTDKALDSLLPQFFVQRIWGTATPIYKHCLVKKAGKILPIYCEEDLEFECRIGLLEPKLKFVDRHLTDIRHHDGERFSVDNANRAKQLSDQIQAREHIYQAMLEFGLGHDSEEIKLLAKFMFLLARQTGELNLVEQSTAAFELARKAGQKLHSKDKFAMEFYRIANHMVGGKNASIIFSSVYNRLHQLKN